jgi:hypothetical protein
MWFDMGIFGNFRKVGRQIDDAVTGSELALGSSRLNLHTFPPASPVVLRSLRNMDSKQSLVSTKRYTRFAVCTTM